MINCNPFIVFLMSLECVKGVFYCQTKTQVQIKKESSSEQENKGSGSVTLTLVDTWLDRSKLSL